MGANIKIEGRSAIIQEIEGCRSTVISTDLRPEQLWFLQD